jgi:hypothetical protein
LEDLKYFIWSGNINWVAIKGRDALALQFSHLELSLEGSVFKRDQVVQLFVIDLEIIDFYFKKSPHGFNLSVNFTENIENGSRNNSIKLLHLLRHIV